VSSIDITEFVKAHRERLFDALVAAGVPRENLQEACSRRAPFGRWNRPVVVFDKLTKKPLASYFLSYPKVGEDQKTVRFNINTFNTVLSHFHVSEESNPGTAEGLEPTGIG